MEVKSASRMPENEAAGNLDETRDVVDKQHTVKAEPSLGEHCVTDRPTPSGVVPTGEITKINNIEVYITKPADYPHSPSKLLLLLTGGTGIRSSNNQIQADKYAAEGFLVLMPDQFGGDTTIASATTTSTNDQTLIEKVKSTLCDTGKAFMIDMWLARHTPEKVLPILHKVIEGAKDEFADAYANGGGLYALGYCFGARYVLQLAAENASQSLAGPKTSEDEPSSSVRNEPCIKVGAIAHGTQITPHDIEGVKVPMLLVCVEQDPLFPEEVLQQGLKGLEKSNIEHEIKLYPHVPHGFAVLGEYDDPKIQEAQAMAFTQMLEWLQTH